MPKLLIDPLADQACIALVEKGTVLRVARGESDDRSLALEEAFRSLRLAEAVDEVVLINGPGNFTALRTGLGFARGLGFAFDVPTRGISIFEVDALIAKKDNVTLYRDARGGRFYKAILQSGKMQDIELVSQVEDGGYSCERIDATEFVSATADMRLLAAASLCLSDIGERPAKARYVRPPDAALPSEPPLVILDA